MKYLSSLRFATFVFPALVLLCAPLSRAEEQSPTTRDDQPLVIADGKFTHQGDTGPATLRRVVEVIRQRYPEVNINVVGVEEVVIKNLVLHWGIQRDPHQGGRRVNPPLQSVLGVIAEAAGQGVQVQDFERSNFLLRREGHLRHEAQPRTEVFNLSNLLPRAPNRAALEEDLKRLQLRLALGEKRMTADHPHITGLQDEIALIKALMDGKAGPSDEAIKQLVGQIQDAVKTTLALQNADEQPPTFQFHPGTNLLIATGSGAAVGVTTKVLAAMRENR